MVKNIHRFTCLLDWHSFKELNWESQNLEPTTGTSERQEEWCPYFEQEVYKGYLVHCHVELVLHKILGPYSHSAPCASCKQYSSNKLTHDQHHQKNSLVVSQSEHHRMGHHGQYPAKQQIHTNSAAGSWPACFSFCKKQFTNNTHKLGLTTLSYGQHLSRKNKKNNPLKNSSICPSCGASINSSFSSTGRSGAASSGAKRMPWFWVEGTYPPEINNKSF